MSRVASLVTALLAGLLALAIWATLERTPWLEVGWMHELMRAVFLAQRELYRDMAQAVGDYRDRAARAPLLWLMGLSFVYGVFHAVGPGHGKLVISSYLVARGSRMRRGLWITLASALAQAASAVALVGTLAIGLHVTGRRIEAQTQTLEIASYALIVLVGFWMLYGALRRAQPHAHGPAHSFDPLGVGDETHYPPGAGFLAFARRHHVAAVVLAVGIRPCSGAILVLLFTLGQGIFAVGIAAAVVMALGTALTVASLALFTVVSRAAAVRLARRKSRWEGLLERALELLGSLAVLAGGSLFLLVALQQPVPL
ncbi:MAG TPA: nickel transporter [Alphaproteobacteria bacterium]|nr:nickel transporter [Alphaproteobacteria bacterium]